MDIFHILFALVIFFLLGLVAYILISLNSTSKALAPLGQVLTGAVEVFKKKFF